MESYTGQEDSKGLLGLKYMLLCKIMLNLPEDVHNIINGKVASKHSGSDIEAMLWNIDRFKNSKKSWRLTLTV